MQLTINDQPVELDADPQMPLLWLLRDELNLTAHQVRLRRGADALQVDWREQPAGAPDSGVGLTAALHGRIDIEAGVVQQRNFPDYPLLALKDTPHIETHIAPSERHPGGVGEPGTPPIAPAVANALFALTRKRLRDLPLTL